MWKVALIIIGWKSALTHSQQLIENAQDVQSGLNILGVLEKTQHTYLKKNAGLDCELLSNSLLLFYLNWAVQLDMKSNNVLIRVTLVAGLLTVGSYKTNLCKMYIIDVPWI